MYISTVVTGQPIAPLLLLVNLRRGVSDTHKVGLLWGHDKCGEAKLEVYVRIHFYSYFAKGVPLFNALASVWKVFRYLKPTDRWTDNRHFRSKCRSLQRRAAILILIFTNSHTTFRNDFKQAAAARTSACVCSMHIQRSSRQTPEPEVSSLSCGRLTPPCLISQLRSCILEYETYSHLRDRPKLGGSGPSCFSPLQMSLDLPVYIKQP